MKELSIEEKAKLYDEGLIVAKQWYNDSDTTKKEKYLLKGMFPELAESEDERIRKEIVEHFKETIDNIRAEEEIPREGTVLIANMRRWIAWLEEQGEQKPTDKVEPKFKVGNWIIFNENHNSVYQIERIDNYRYYLRHYLGGTMSVHFDNKLIRHWTIQDAKDGDVLVNGSNIFIFHFLNDTRLMGYCHVNTDNGRFYDDIGKNECFCLIDAVVTPATKEQRDLLFQKIHEAGYEWDAEKKELKKIEQKSVELPHVVDRENIEEYAYQCAYDLSNDWAKESPDWHDVETACKLGAEWKEKHLTTMQKPEWSKEEKSRLMKKCVHKAYQRGYDTGFLMATTESEHKQEWSEEDWKLLDEVREHIVCIMGDKPVFTPNKIFEGFLVLIDRLKFAKPHLKQDWSEKYIADVFEKVGLAKIVREQSNDALTNALQHAMIELSKFMPQPKQEWSEEDEEMFGNVLSTLSICSNNPDIPIDVRKMHQKEYAWFDELYNRFYSQPQWKPSKEQIEALLEAAQGLYSCKEKNLLLDLYEQLKAL